ncbi:hypothetical protein FRC11_004838, partial [Ceratobasidium sp. 423]
MSTDPRKCLGCTRFFTNASARKSHQTQTQCLENAQNQEGHVPFSGGSSQPDDLPSDQAEIETYISNAEALEPPGATGISEFEQLDETEQEDSGSEASDESDSDIDGDNMDMLGEQQQHRQQARQAETSASPAKSEAADRHVTMRKLPEEVDQAITEFLNDLLLRNGVLGAEMQDENGSETDSEDDDTDTDGQETTDPDEMEVESLLDAEFEDDAANFEDNENCGSTTDDVMSPSSDVTMAGIAHGDEQELFLEETYVPGARLRPCLNRLQQLHRQKVLANTLPSWPFSDYLEFEFVKWMVDNDISQGARDKLIKLPIIAERAGLSFSSNYALNKLLDKLPTAGPRWRRIERLITGNIVGADGKKLTELVEIWMRDILEVVQELLGSIVYGKQLVFVPQKVYLNGVRKIDEMWTADWWNEIQKNLPPGATVIPIIIASDATQLTNFLGGKSAWPVYITIGNIPKGIRAKVNNYSTMLLAYLPVAKFDCFAKKDKGNEKAKLFHESMKIILEPLEKAGREGIEM